jgi:hypothetical protein
MPMQRAHHRNMRHHRIAAVLANQHQALNSGFPLWNSRSAFGSLMMYCAASQRDELATKGAAGSDRRTAAASHRDFCHESYLPST